MNASYGTPDPSRQRRGIAVALLVHVLLAWVLISGTARKGLELLDKPLQAVIIQEVAVAPAPPPPKVVPPPKAQLTPVQPPPFVPAPELVVAQPPTLAIEAATVVHEAPPPAPVPVQQAAPTPAVKLDMAIVCPTQVAPEIPRRALLDGTQGVVRAQVKIADGAVREVTFLSGPRIFYAAVRSAMLQYRCSREGGEVVATQDFNFRMQP